MAVQDNRSLTLERRPGERSRGVSLRPLGERLTSLFRGTRDHDRSFGEEQPTEVIGQELWAEEEVLPRFPFVRHGYHCGAVDTHLAELEQELAEVDRELAELRAHSTSQDEVANQIKRIGEQTSAVLIAANEQREEMLRAAREEAERCVTEARAKATLITSEGEARLRDLHAQHGAAERERDRLLEEVRNISAALAALADSPHGPVATS